MSEEDSHLKSLYFMKYMKAFCTNKHSMKHEAIKNSEQRLIPFKVILFAFKTNLNSLPRECINNPHFYTDSRSSYKVDEHHKL